MAHEYTVRRRVDFADTDMAGIMHFSNYFRYMEGVEHAFFRTLGLRLHGDRDGTMHGFARVHAACDYLRPLRYDDEVEIRLVIEHRGARSLRYRFIFTRIADQTGPCAREVVARGTETVVHVTRAPGEDDIKPSELTPQMIALLEPAPIELLPENESA
jgi:YbgC/YbaW family acyl-CoA thioester hydrolase